MININLYNRSCSQLFYNKLYSKIALDALQEKLMYIMRFLEKQVEERPEILDGIIKDLSHLNLSMETILIIRQILEEQKVSNQNKHKEIPQNSNTAIIFLKTITGKQE